MLSLRSQLLACLGFVASARTVFATTGRATFYDPNGIQACGINSTPNDFVVGLNDADYANGNNCFRKIHVTYQGKSVDVTAVNYCPECPQGGIDLSRGAFAQLADLNLGMITVDWEFV